MNIWHKNIKYQEFKKEIDDNLEQLEVKYKGKSIIGMFLVKILRKLFYFMLYIYKLEPPKD